jgi:hypothetical protein
MNTQQKLLQSELEFQSWLKASYDTHQKDGVQARDFTAVGSPTASGDKYSCFEYLFKRTVRTPSTFIGNHDAFAIALKEFIIENVLDLYGSSIRVAMNGNESLAFYKDCGGEMGGFWCGFKREGNIFTLSVGYQIYWGYNSILIDPKNLLSPNTTNITKTYAYSAKKRLDFFYSKRFFTFLTISIIFGSIAFGLVDAGGMLSILGVLIGLFTGGYMIACWQRWSQDETKSERAEIEREFNVRVGHDLSPIHFPVKYFSHEVAAEAIAKNYDHQVFIERLSSVLEKAVLAGEQSN